MMIASLTRICAACALLILCACGQKGALYLPQKNGTVVSGAGVPPPAQSGPAVPAPAPQPQSAPEQTIPGTPAQPLTTPPQDGSQVAPPPPRDTQQAAPPKRNHDADDSDSQAPK
jgi:predicted small lipoprotein YifL